MIHPYAKIKGIPPYPKPRDSRKSIDGLAALVELDIKVAVFEASELFPYTNNAAAK